MATWTWTSAEAAEPCRVQSAPSLVPGEVDSSKFIVRRVRGKTYLAETFKLTIAAYSQNGRDGDIISSHDTMIPESIWS